MVVTWKLRDVFFFFLCDYFSWTDASGCVCVCVATLVDSVEEVLFSPSFWSLSSLTLSEGVVYTGEAGLCLCVTVVSFLQGEPWVCVECEGLKLSDYLSWLFQRIYPDHHTQRKRHRVCVRETDRHRDTDTVCVWLTHRDTDTSLKSLSVCPCVPSLAVLLFRWFLSLHPLFLAISETLRTASYLLLLETVECSVSRCSASWQSSASLFFSSLFSYTDTFY